MNTRTLTPDDLPAAHALTQAAGWPHRVEDWRFGLDLGFGVAVEEDSILLGAAMGWDFGAIGMIVVAEQARGRGLGRVLTEAVLARLGPFVHLHATEAGRPLYEKLGFVARGQVHQHQGPARIGEAPPLRLATAEDLPMLAALDAAAQGVRRDALIAALLAQGSIALADDGFAAIRPFGRGEVIGPVVAPDRATAQRLIGYWMARRAGAFLRVDTPDADLAAWLAERGLARVGGALAMARGPAPDRGRVFALANQALG